MSAPSRTVMGHEMEYAVVVLDAHGDRMEDRGLDLLEVLAPSIAQSLPWEERGFAMLNGSRFYRDAGGNFAHLEIATAETSNPADLIAQVEAGHRFILRVAGALKKNPLVGSVTVSCNTVDYSSQPATCGSHESYFVPVSGAARTEVEDEDDIPF